MWIALFDPRQNARHIGHGYEDSQPAAEMPENACGRAWAMPKSLDKRVSENVPFPKWSHRCNFRGTAPKAGIPKNSSRNSNHRILVPEEVFGTRV
jgi:hypothetical protein